LNEKYNVRVFIDKDDNILLNKKRKPKKKHFKTYLCEFCNKAYSNGQGLGGHMSRIHPNQSYKYKDKIRIRREREEKRENLLNIKRDLFKKYGFDYDKLVAEKNKVFIQKFLFIKLSPWCKRCIHNISFNVMVIKCKIIEVNIPKHIFKIKTRSTIIHWFTINKSCNFKHD